MAGYNCGEGCVNRAIQKEGVANFWTLASRKALPTETRNYVSKVIAMAHIGQNPDFYGFDDINYQEPLDYQLIKIDEIESSSHVHISALSKKLDISLEELKALNPHYKGNHIPDSYAYLRVPASL